MTWVAILRGAKAVAFFTIPIPLALIAAAWLWVTLDKTSAVRLAVDKAVVELVAGAELAAAQAQLTEERRLRALAEGKAQALAEANTKFDEARQIADLESERLGDELESLKALPLPIGCVVDDALLERLR